MNNMKRVVLFITVILLSFPGLQAQEKNFGNDLVNLPTNSGIKSRSMTTNGLDTTINVINAGTLSTLLTTIDKATITNLTVTGSIDARDVKCMRDSMPILAILDMSNSTIQAYKGNEGTSNSTGIYLVNEMPENSFYYSSGQGKTTLKSIKLPVTLTSVGSYAFYNCSGLSDITIPDLVTSIATLAFYNCFGLSNLTIGSGVVSIGDNAFYNCPKLTGLVIPNSVTSLGTNVFYGSNGLTSLTIGNGLTSINDNAFYNCTQLRSVIIGTKITSIGQNSFYGCTGLTSITIPNSVKSIGDGAYYGCVGLTSLIIPNSVSSIGQGSFYGCTGLTSITIGNGINSIPYTCFAGCSNLKVLRCFNNTPPTVGNAGFDSVNPTVVYVPVGTLAAYKAADIWKDFSTIYEYILNVSTQSVSSVNTTAKLTGSINVIADTPVIAHGFCWNTTGSPTIADNKVDNGAGTVTGSFMDTITGLTPKTTYYVKAFATDSVRTVYGNEMSFTVTLLPETAGVISGMQTICPGESAVTYTVPAINNALSYTWTLPSGVTGTSTSDTIHVKYALDAISGTISVKGHNDSGDGVASSLAITVNQLPVIELNDTSIACGGSIQLYPFVQYSGSGTLKYKWTPSTGLNSDTIATPFATCVNNITYTLTVTTPNGCVASNSLKIAILPMNQPEIGIVSVSNNKNRVVWNKPVTTGIASYYIYKETNTTNVFEKIGTVSYDSMSVFVDSLSYPDVKSNKYKLSILDRNGLESALSDYHKTMHLSINKGQNNTWNLIWEPYEGFSVSTYNIYRGTSPNSLSYLDGTSGSSTQYSDISAPSGDVYYQLEVISPTLISPSKVLASMQKSVNTVTTSSATGSYNSSRSNIATNDISGLNDLEGENSNINIYPNPVKDELRIDFDGGTTFDILNLTGQVVYNGNLTKSAIVQTSGLTSGVYLIRFKTSKTFEYKKIIKE